MKGRPMIVNTLLKDLSSLPNTQPIEGSLSTLTSLNERVEKLLNRVSWKCQGGDVAHLLSYLEEQLVFEKGLESWTLKERSFSKEAVKVILDTYYHKRTRLDLSKYRLSTLPKEIGRLSHLQFLDLSENSLKSLPKELKDLQNLKFLRLQNNQLSQYPEQLSELKNLSLLDLSSNNLNELPKSIGALYRITNLYLGNNNLTSLPNSISACSHLTRLDLRGNLFETFPLVVTDLSRLSSLNLSENQLQSLPQEIGKLKDLNYLFLDKNKLSYLPLTLSESSHMKHISWEDNSFSKERVSEILELALIDKEKNLDLFSDRLQMWSRQASLWAKKEFYLEFLMAFSTEQKHLLDALLVGLAQTCDFTYSQGLLAARVCLLLEDLTNADFKSRFFNQLKGETDFSKESVLSFFDKLYLDWASFRR